MQPRMDVDVRLLESVTKSVEAAAATLGAAVSAAGSGLAPPPGSTAATAARAVEEGWLAELRRAQQETATFAAELTAAGEQYLATDQAGGHELWMAGTEGPR